MPDREGFLNPTDEPDAPRDLTVAEARDLLDEGEGEPGQVTDPEHGVPGDAEPMPETDDDGADVGPDELGEQDTTDDAPVEIDPSAGDDVDAGAGDL